MLRQFSKDKNFLTKYHLKWIALLGTINVALVLMAPPSWSSVAWYWPAILMMTSTKIEIIIGAAFYAIGVTAFRGEFTPFLGLVALATLPFNFTVIALLHNAAHGSLRPRWLNRPIGELSALFHLVGFADWKILHVFHHAHSDDPARDPHPPGNKPFWEFAKGMREAVLRAFLRAYFERFDQSPDSMRALKSFGLASKVDLLMKVTFWFLLLKGPLFSSLFATAVAFKMMQYAWLNWITHRPAAKGEEILNIDQGLYRIGNFFGFGTFYHRNHHEAPHLFDPRKLKPSSSKKENQAARSAA